MTAAPHTFRARPGRWARHRFINAGGDTAFRVALGGHRMTVTHTDGCPVTPAETDGIASYGQLRAAAGTALPARAPDETHTLDLTHCHNVYHAEAGMMTVLGYQT